MRLLADASQYNRTLDQVQSKARQFAEGMAKATGTPFTGMTRQMENAVARSFGNAEQFKRQWDQAATLLRNRHGQEVDRMRAKHGEQLRLLNAQQNAVGMGAAQRAAQRGDLMRRQASEERLILGEQNRRVERFNLRRDLAERGMRARETESMAAAMRARERLARGAADATRKMSGGIQDADRAFTGFFTRATGHITSMTNRAVRMTTILAGVGGGLGVLGFGVEAARLAGDYERAAVAFEVMTRSAEVGKKLLDDITRLAIETPFTSAELIQNAKQVKAFGFDTRDVIPIISRLGDISQGTGAQMDRLILAFGQTRAIGRLMGQELRQFTNAGVPILEYLGRVMNVSTERVPQLVRQGRVGFNEVAAAINMMTNEGGLFANMMDRINKETVYGRWQNLVESFQLTGRNLGLAAFEAFKLKEVLTDLGEGIRGVSESDAKEFFVGFKSAIIMSWTAIKELVKWVDHWTTRNRELVNSLLAAIIAVKVGIFLFVTLKAAFLLLISPIGILVGSIAALIFAFSELGAFEGIGEGLSRGWRSFSSVVSESWRAVKEAVAGDNFDLAWKITLKTMEVGWKVLMLSLQAEWEKFSFNMGTIVVKNLQLALLDVLHGFADIGVRITSAMVSVFPGGIGGEEFRRRELNKLNAEYMKAKDAIDKRAAEKALERRGELEGRVNEIFGPQMEKVLNDPELRALRQEALIPNKLPVDILDRYKDTFRPTNQAFARFPREWAGKGDPYNAMMSVLGPGAEAFPSTLEQITQANQRAVEAVRNYEAVLNATRAGTATPDQIKQLPELLENAKRFAAEADKFDLTLAAKLENSRAEIAKTLSAIPHDVQEAVQDLEKTLREGVTPFEQYSKQVERLNFAVRGAFPSAGAMAAIGAPGIAGLFGDQPMPSPLIDQEEHGLGLFMAYERLRSGLRRPDQLMPPAAMMGTREAVETINRSNAQRLSVEEQVLETLRMSQEVQRQQAQYQKEVSATLLRIEGQGGTVPVPIKK